LQGWAVAGYDAVVKKLLYELEARLAELPPAERAELVSAYRDLVRGVVGSTKVISGHFRPSKVAVLGLLTDLVGALGNGAKFLAGLKALAPKVGPHVTALVRDL
jgi:hypothetical protein